MDLARSALAITPDEASIIRYLRAGSGAPLLVLWDQNDAAFLASVPKLAAAFRVIAPQIPAGAEYAEQLAAFVDRVGLADIRVLANADFAEQLIALLQRTDCCGLRSTTMITASEDLEAAVGLLCATERDRDAEVASGSDRVHRNMSPEESES